MWALNRPSPTSVTAVSVSNWVTRLLCLSGCRRFPVWRNSLDRSLGVDPHRDSHALAVVQVGSGAVVFESTVVADSDGYARALKLVDRVGCANSIVATGRRLQR